MFYKYLNKKLRFIPPSSDTQLFEINWSPLGASKDGECRMSSRHSPACSILTDFRRGECHSGAGHALGFVIMVAAFFISKSVPMHRLSL